MGGGRESDYSVCPRPLLQFHQFFQFMSDKLCQAMPGYIRLRPFNYQILIFTLLFTTFFFQKGYFQAPLKVPSSLCKRTEDCFSVHHFFSKYAQ